MNTDITPEYSIIIPTFNERDNIVVLLSRLEELYAAAPGTAEIIVIDENSPDGTYDRAREFARSRDFIRVEKNPGEAGLSPSIVYGFDLAEGGLLACMDGDLQHDEKMLPKLFAAAAANDLVIGSRYVEDGGFADKWNPIRKLGSRIVTLLTRLVLKIKVNDPMSGFFVIRRDAYEKIRQRLNPHGFKIMLELLYNLKTVDANAKVREIGILFRNRKHGDSKMNSKVVLQFVKMLFDLKSRR
ncbi:MAG: polyprenol monophosphomannose synthase [Victivallales bacterium]|nr:polyprenol monophosphomannose synthase [Victivallales bacterium]